MQFQADQADKFIIQNQARLLLHIIISSKFLKLSFSIRIQIQSSNEFYVRFKHTKLKYILILLQLWISNQDIVIAIKLLDEHPTTQLKKYNQLFVTYKSILFRVIFQYNYIFVQPHESLRNYYACKSSLSYDIQHYFISSQVVIKMYTYMENFIHIINKKIQFFKIILYFVGLLSANISISNFNLFVENSRQKHKFQVTFGRSKLYYNAIIFQQCYFDETIFDTSVPTTTNLQDRNVIQIFQRKILSQCTTFQHSKSPRYMQSLQHTQKLYQTNDSSFLFEITTVFKRLKANFNRHLNGQMSI
eukprot:TRINITY_DN4982_c0_g1_i6.p1 TRINITY_DN4982_c0_g1~~TRINITY_DN4982_c0_g1_i6.p1  ORF type:complete len:303 (+),score=-9.45 TRINITY_DN4982_c0_g1_i6:600-1508(+)